jgi:hypothetical protein
MEPDPPQADHSVILVEAIRLGNEFRACRVRAYVAPRIAPAELGRCTDDWASLEAVARRVEIKAPELSRTEGEVGVEPGTRLDRR